jgi:hypothetical protein
VDGDDLSVVNLSVVSSDVDNVTLTDNNNGTWTLIPVEVMVKLWSSFVESDTSARLIASWL